MGPCGTQGSVITGSRRSSAAPLRSLKSTPYYQGCGDREASPKKEGGATREAMRRVNQRNAEKDLTRKINANFTPRDLYLTLTYRGIPPDPRRRQRL